jgi:hypothetical protein
MVLRFRGSIPSLYEIPSLQDISVALIIKYSILSFNEIGCASCSYSTHLNTPSMRCTSSPVSSRLFSVLMMGRPAPTVPSYLQ